MTDYSRAHIKFFQAYLLECFNLFTAV